MSEDKKKEESKKEVAAKKILKKMGDKGRYDYANQLKTLIGVFLLLDLLHLILLLLITMV